MDRLRAMQVFVRVVERGSFVRAAEEFGLSHGMASAIVKDLEAHVGVSLIHRTTRRLRLTEEGARYLEAARRILADLAEIEDEIGGAERAPRGRLRIQLPVGLARLVVAPALPGFLAACPHLAVEVLSRNGFPRFLEDALDAAVFIGEPPERDVIARPLGRYPFVTSAAPAYLAARDTPVVPEDLDGHACIGVLGGDTGRSLQWRFARDGHESFRSVPTRIAFEASEPAVAAAVAGGGVLQMIRYLVDADIRAGRLVPVLSDWLYPGAQISLVYPRLARPPRKLRAFEAFLRPLMRAAAV